MPDRIQTIAAIAVSSIALVVMVIGLAAGPASDPRPEARAAVLYDQISCPFCDGETLADSGSQVAADYRALIEERIDDGYTDEQILAEFEGNFGEAYVLDGSGATTVLLWLVPIALIMGGVVVFLTMKRSGNETGVAA